MKFPLPLSLLASGITALGRKKRTARTTTRYLMLKLNFCTKPLLSALALLSLAVPVAFGLAQATKAMPTWQEAAGGTMAFEVATVKPNLSDDPAKVNFTLGPGDTYAETGGRFRASDISLLDYIRFAYKLTDGQTQILQASAPKWIATTRFDIEAKAENLNPTKDQMRLMMQSLLAERFKLAVHTETRELPVLALILAKPGKLGPQLRPHSADDGACSSVMPSANPPSKPKTPSVPTVCGGLMSVGVPGAPSHVRIGGQKLPLTLLAAHLSEMGQFDRPVIDQTGLTGTFDLVLEWGPDSASASTTPEDYADRQTYLQEALQDQLGLKLVPQKAPVDVLLLDHVDRQPSSN